MRTKLFRSIDNEQEARQFLKELFDNGESYHPEDDARDIIFPEVNPTYDERNKLNSLMAQSYNLLSDTFDPAGYLLALLRLQEGTAIELKSLNCIFYTVDEEETDYRIDGIDAQYIPTGFFKNVSQADRDEVYKHYKIDLFETIED